MRYRQLGNSGLTVSVVGLGGNNFGSRADAQQTSAVVNAALDCGITMIDTADVYGRGGGTSESFVGQALKGRRQEAVLATKFGMPLAELPGHARGSRRYVARAVEGSLRRLQTDFIDLYYYHQPDTSTPIEETLAALDDLITAGKVLYVGCSNFEAWRVVEADWTAFTRRTSRFIAVQNRYNLLDRGIEAEVVPACLRYGLGIIPYSPLAGGFLTGKYRPGEPPAPGTRLADRGGPPTEDMFDRLRKLEAYASERGRGLLEVAISGLAAQPVVGSVICGAMTPEQVRANAAAGDWEPSAEDLAALDAIVASCRPTGPRRA